MNETEVIILVLLICFVIYYLNEIKNYKSTDYYLQTHKSYFSVKFDKGNLGEYYLYCDLKGIAGYKRFLFNCYIPKPNGEYTEIDLMLLHESGIFIFESKNYSGWIFGAERNKYWTQTLPAGKRGIEKHKFFNPIIQNQIHIKYLNLIIKQKLSDIYSYVIFSNRCSLKKIELISNNHFVIHRDQVNISVRRNIARSINKFSAEKIDSIYDMLYPFTQLDNTKKQEHIQNIRNRYGG